MGFEGGVTVLMSLWLGDDPALFGRALESVAAQTLAPDATLLVVDGPIPVALEAEIAAAPLPLTLHRLPENVGLAGALTSALPRIATTWIARADADDINHPDRLARQAAALAADPALDLLGSAIIETDEAGRVTGERAVPREDAAIRARLPWRNPFNHQTVIVRAALVRGGGGWPPIAGREDYALWARLLARGAKAANLAEPLVTATAGAGLVRRRGGAANAVGELALQRLLVREGISRPPAAFARGLARAAAFLAPGPVRAALYRTFLRRREGAASVRRESAGLGAGAGGTSGHNHSGGGW